MNVDRFFAGFSESWSQFVKYPLPSFLKGPTEDYDEGSPLTRPMTPVVGFVIGTCLAFICWLGGLFAGHVIPFLTGAFIVPFLLQHSTGWSGITAPASFLARISDGDPIEQALSGEAGAERIKTYPVMLMVVYLLQCIFLGMFAAYHAADWFLIVFTCAYLIRAELAAIPSEGTGVAFFDAPPSVRTWHWYIGGAIVLLTGIFQGHLVGAFTALIFVCGMVWYFRKVLSGIREWTLTPYMMDVFGYTGEIILLLLGIVFYAK